MKKLIILVTATALVATMAASIAATEAVAKPVELKEEVAVAPIAQAKTTPATKGNMGKIAYDKDTYKVDIKFPITGNEALDKTLKAVATDALASFEKDLTELKPSEEQLKEYKDLDMKSSFEISYKKAKTGDFQSYLLNPSYYIMGAAHGYYYYESINYDAKNDKIVELKDLFVKEGYLDVIAKECTNTLKKKLGDEFASESINTDAKTYETFVLTDKGITFVFDPYVVASYASGEQYVTIAYKTLNAYLNPALGLK